MLASCRSTTKSPTVELLNSPEQRRPWAPWFPTSVVENTRLGQFGNWRLRCFLGTNSTAVKQSHLYWNYRHLPRPRSPRHLLHAAVSCVCQCQSRDSLRTYFTTTARTFTVQRLLSRVLKTLWKPVNFPPFPPTTDLSLKYKYFKISSFFIKKQQRVFCIL